MMKFDDFQNSNEIVKEVKESFLANLNHSIRTPLNGLVGMTTLLSKTKLEDEQEKYVHIIRETTEQLMLQLENIVEVTKVDAGEISSFKIVVLKDLIKSAVQRVIPLSEKRSIPVIVDITKDVPEKVKLDVNRLRMVIVNLLSVALKYSDHGKIVLKISRIDDGDSDNSDENSAILRFAIENNNSLYDALYKTLEAHGHLTNAQDLTEFGDVSVSLFTVQKLLHVMDSALSFAGDEDNEPPFFFDINIYFSNKYVVDETIYSRLAGKRILLYQSDILEMTMLVQSLRLWDIDYRITADEEGVMDEIVSAEREGRPYDIMICEGFLFGTELLEIRQKVAHVVVLGRPEERNRAFMDEFDGCLCPPVYPEELLLTLSAIYPEVQVEREFSFMDDASDYLGIERDNKIKFKGRILLVEDDMVSRMYAAEILEGYGCTVTIAEDGAHALARLENMNECDLVLMDCMMPRMDGYTATAKIREHSEWDRLPIVALTANTLENDKERCIECGMDNYIAKPVKERDVIDILSRYLQRVS